ncbi:MAG TPA: hypothetical protein VHY91_12370 [Pirellulales bacterium]|jgi:hypothetical protein|nr:hypothetical protein [Pirellulales bacterium]
MFRGSLLSVLVASWLVPLNLRGDSYEIPSFDLARDFSADKNPNGPWTIGSFNHTYSGKLDELQNLPAYGKLTFTKTERAWSAGGLRGWGGISTGLFGASPTATGVVKNFGTTTTYAVPAGSIAVFPQNGPIVVRWTAPKNGNIDLRAKYVDLTDIAGFPEVWVVQNQAVRSPLHYQKAYTRPGKAADHFAPAAWSGGRKSEYRGTISVVANDTIDFVVDPMYTVCPGHSEHPDGNATDTIGLTATIDYIVDSGFTD